MDIYFILQIINQLWIINQDYCVYFATLNVLVLVTGNPFIWLLHPLDTPPSIVHFVCVLACFWETPYFLALNDAASSFFTSPVTVLKSAISPSSSASLSGSGLRNHHPKAICAGSCSGAVASFLSQLTRQGNICLYFNYWIYLFIYQWISASISIWSSVCDPMDCSMPGSTTSRSLLKFMSIVSVMPSNHLILCHPLILWPSVFPRSRVFPLSWLLASGG